jgi:hypothetical protein
MNSGVARDVCAVRISSSTATFSFGRPWVTSSLLRGANLDAILPSYTVSLSLSSAIVAGFPLFTLIIVTCGEWRRGGRPS